MGDSRSALGRRIHRLRESKGITQEKLAEKAGISPKSLSDLERGRGNPTLSSLDGLAEAFGITLADLFDFGHERLSSEEIRRELQSILNNSTEEDCRVYYRLLSDLKS